MLPFLRMAKMFRVLWDVMTFCVLLCSLTVTLFFSAVPARAQEGAVTAQVEVVHSKMDKGNKKAPSATRTEPSDVVIWLTARDGAAAARAGTQEKLPQLVQHNKRFEPRLLVVRVGMQVQFPNKDHFLHNVFSLYDGKRFDLGFYEAGSSRSVRFDRLGVSFLFCNIHPEMSATVVAVDTPYFGLSDSTGRVAIAGVPDGNYVMHVWWERSLPDDLKSLERGVTISGGERGLGAVRVIENPNFTLTHKNKYGQDYVPPSSGDYSHP
jgi:plastocyanin